MQTTRHGTASDGVGGRERKTVVNLMWRSLYFSAKASGKLLSRLPWVTSTGRSRCVHPSECASSAACPSAESAALLLVVPCSASSA